MEVSSQSMENNKTLQEKRKAYTFLMGLTIESMKN